MDREMWRLNCCGHPLEGRSWRVRGVRAIYRWKVDWVLGSGSDVPGGFMVLVSDCKPDEFLILKITVINA